MNKVLQKLFKVITFRYFSKQGQKCIQQMVHELHEVHCEARRIRKSICSISSSEVRGVCRDFSTTFASAVVTFSASSNGVARSLSYVEFCCTSRFWGYEENGFSEPFFSRYRLLPWANSWRPDLLPPWEKRCSATWQQCPSSWYAWHSART